MKLLALAILAAAILVAGSVLYVGGAFENIFRPAWQEPVSARLRNPDSAQFRNVRIGELTGWVCGEVNGENALGAMGDWVEFMARPPTDLEGFERVDWEITLVTDYAAVVGFYN